MIKYAYILFFSIIFAEFYGICYVVYYVFSVIPLLFFSLLVIVGTFFLFLLKDDASIFTTINIPFELSSQKATAIECYFLYLIHLLYPLFIKLYFTASKCYFYYYLHFSKKFLKKINV